MMMQQPIGSFFVDLHASRPYRAVDFYLGVEEVGTGVGVLYSGIDNSDRKPLGGSQWSTRVEFVFPNIV